LDDALQSGLISLPLYADLLASLVCLSRFDAVDDYVMGLPKGHQLFSLTPCHLERIAYGSNHNRYRPIRVHSLICFLDVPHQVGPCNSWILGNFVLAQYLDRGVDIFDVPMIREIGNRFILHEHAGLLLQRPAELVKYCDPEFDHFPLFQFFRCKEALQMAEKFKSVSFWVRFSDVCDRVIPFFHSNSIELTIKRNAVTVYIDDDEMGTVQVKPTSWTHIFLTEDDPLFSSSATILIGGKAVKGTRKIRGKFQVASFESTSASTLMFLGPAVRFYERDLVEPGDLFGKGPGFMDQLHEEEKVVLLYHFTSPFSTTQKAPPGYVLPLNCIAVPYFGVPFHFTPDGNFGRLFELLGGTASAEEYSQVFNALLNINSITLKDPQICGIG
jgi:hypothetical protein